MAPSPGEEQLGRPNSDGEFMNDVSIPPPPRGRCRGIAATVSFRRTIRIGGRGRQTEASRAAQRECIRRSPGISTCPQRARLPSNPRYRTRHQSDRRLQA